MNTVMHLLQLANSHHIFYRLYAYAPPTPSPTPTVTIQPGAVLANLGKLIIPILGGIVGVVIMTRSKRGAMAESANSGLVFAFGLVLFAGAVLWPLLGDWLVSLIVSVTGQ